MHEQVKTKKRSEQGGKTRLVEVARQHGCSKRKAEKLVNCLFNQIARALARDEDVELPFGTLNCKQYTGKGRVRFQRTVNIQTGKRKYRIMRYPGARRVIRFKPDPELDLTTRESKRGDLDAAVSGASTLGEANPESIAALLDDFKAGHIKIETLITQMERIIGRL